MAKRLTILLVALLAFGFVVSGCGDDDDDKAKDDTATTEAPAAEATTGEKPTEPSTGGGSAASGVPDSPEVKQAVENCKKQAAANAQLSAEAKDKIGEVCEQAASGDADGAAKATREACVIIVEDTAPAGAAKEAALQACKQSTPTPR